MTAARTHAAPAPTPLRGRSGRTGPRDDVVLLVPPRSLVVLAGLPGAGKTTLLRRLTTGRSPLVRLLDAEEVAEVLRARVRRLPYRVLRPAVHGLHLLRVLRDVRGPAACVLTTDPMTSVARRALLLGAARCSGRSLSVVLVDATEQQARSGQRERGRTVGERRMSRHVARAGRLRPGLARGGGMSFVDEVLVVSRPVAASATRVVVGPTGPGPHRPALHAA